MPLSPTLGKSAAWTTKEKGGRGGKHPPSHLGSTEEEGKALSGTRKNDKGREKLRHSVTREKKGSVYAGLHALTSGPGEEGKGKKRGDLLSPYAKRGRGREYRSRKKAPTKKERQVPMLMKRIRRVSAGVRAEIKKNILTLPRKPST